MILILCLIQLSVALLPIRDFRVSQLGYVKSTARKNQPNYTSLSSHNSSILNLTKSKTIKFLSTDDLNSVYYLNLSLHGIDYSQTFPLLFDTGSAISWIYNTSCNESNCQFDNVTKFDYPVHGPSFSLSYSNEEVNGEIIDLTQFNISSNISNMKFNFSLGITSNYPSILRDYYLSGILGVSSARTEFNILNSLYDQGQIDQRKFGMYLLPSTYQNQLYGGVLLFGNESNANVTTTDVSVEPNYNNFWIVNSTICINDQELFNRSVIIDSGTTGIVLPFNDSVHIHQKLFEDGFVYDNNGNFAFLCNLTNEIEFLVNDGKLSIDTESIKGLEYGGSLAGYCASKIQGLDHEHWILGGAFLKNYYTIFNLDEQVIQFSQLTASSIYLIDPQPTTTNLVTSSCYFDTSTSSLTSIPASFSTSESTSFSSSTHTSYNLGHTLKYPWAFLALCIFT